MNVTYVQIGLLKSRSPADIVMCYGSLNMAQYADGLLLEKWPILNKNGDVSGYDISFFFSFV